jgi:outer membrane protein TolC
MKAIADNHEQYELHTSIDILQNDMKYKKQLVLLNQAKANLLGAQFTLNDIMNIEGSKVMYDTVEASLFAKNLSILDINIPEYQVIEDTAMEFSYALAIAEQNIEKRGAEVTQAKRKRIPDVTVAGGYAYQTAHQTRGAALPGAFVGATVDVPILYSFTPDVKKAKIVLNRAEIDKASFENHLKFALKEDYNDFKYAKQNITYYKEILESSRGVLEEYKKRYERGQVMLLHLLQVETAHQENVREYINAVQVFYDAYLNLMQNVGHDILLEEEM